MNRITIILSLVVIVVSTAFSQNENAVENRIDSVRGESKGASITVVCNRPCYVYDDSVLIGKSPLENARITAGLHVFRYSRTNEPSWFDVPIVETLLVGSDEHIKRNVFLPYIYRIVSEPFGATVQKGDSIIGQTPCVFSTFSYQSLLTVSKNDYKQTSIPLSSEDGPLYIRLEPTDLSATTGSAYAGNDISRSSTPIYIATATTVLAGAAAAFFKIKADNSYAEYQQSGNGDLLSRVKTYDRVSGVALVTSEVSLFLLTYFLSTR